MGKNIALVLSSGGARGFAHIGAIKVLESEGYNITSVAGTSMGALVGGIYAAGQIREFEEWVRTLDVMEVLKLTDITISSRGFVKGKKVIEKMEEIVPARKIEDLLIPFSAVATDLVKGTEKVFTEGSLFDAIRASISIPTVFQPFKVGKDFFVDGGLVNPIPINRVVRHEGDILAVVDVNADIPHDEVKKVEEEVEDNRYMKIIKSLRSKTDKQIPKNKKDDIGLFNLNTRSISIMLNQIASLTLQHHSIDIMVHISRESYSTYDFYKASEIISAGEKATRKALGLAG
ncbi:MAG: patatin-like phospholipase family protein [Bacteroidales bacterium]|jgi:NTE family protein|nr:patatin-like phospholipase family protein [Bacteroidales bacterium]